LREHARAAFGRFRTVAGDLPITCAPAFLIAALVPQLLAWLDAAAADPFAAVEVPQWRRQWALWRAARRWPRL
jgi:15-cis-phytoene synthase